MSSYKWLGIEVLTWEDVQKLHIKGKLSGCYKLYPDGTESEISESYDWSEIQQHHDNGGRFGQELPTVELELLDGKKIVVPEVVDISALGTLDELEYSLWNTIEEYLALFGIRTEDNHPDFATVKAVQDKLLDVLTDAGINFKLFTEEQTQAMEKELKKDNTEAKGKEKFKVAFEVVVTDENIDDIMVSALEGGINYWCSKAEVEGEYLGEYASDQISRGGELILYDREYTKIYTLSKDKFIEGLKKYIAAGNTECVVREVDNGIYTGNLNIDTCRIDSSAADCIIQYAIFCDVFYS